MHRLVVFVSIMMTSVLSVSGTCLDPVGKIADGPASRISVTGDLALLANGRTLSFIDVSVQGRPEEISSIVFPDLIRNIERAGDSLAFVAAGETGLWIVDFSSLEAPSLSPVFHTEDYSTRAIEKVDEYLYVLESSWTPEGAQSLLQVLDIHDLMRPEKIATLERSASFRDLVFLNGVLAVTDGWGYSLDIIDVSNPSAPSFLAEYRLHDNPNGIATDGNNLFLSTIDRVIVFELSDSNSPSVVGTLDDLDPYLTHIGISGNYAYVPTSGGQENKLFVLNIEDPVHPSLLNSIPIESSAWATAILADRLFVAAGGRGMLEFDISSPDEPLLAGAWDTPGSMLDIALSGNYLYTAERFSEMRVFDLSDPSSPIFLPQSGVLPVGWRVKTFGKLLLQATNTGLGILDISDPSSPTPISEIEGRILDFTMKGEVAYLLIRENKLVIFNLEDPRFPMEISRSSIPAGGASNIEINHGYAIITDSGCPFSSGCEPQLLVVDIQDPVHPVVEGSLVLYGADELDVSAHHAFVMGRHLLSIVDFSDPAAPFLESSFVLEPSGSSAVFSENGITTVVLYDSIVVLGTFFLDHPTLRKRMDLNTSITNAALSGGHLYVAAGANGLLIFHDCRVESVEKPGDSAFD